MQRPDDHPEQRPFAHKYERQLTDEERAAVDAWRAVEAKLAKTCGCADCAEPAIAWKGWRGDSSNPRWCRAHLDALKAATKSARHTVPMSERPPCLGCGEPLKPVYDTLKVTEYVDEELDHLPSDARDYHYDEDTHLYVVERSKTTTISREFKGFTRWGGEDFHSVGCAAAFGRAVARRLREKSTP